MADITLAFNMLHNVWTETTVFNIGWILNVVATIITAWLVTSDKERIIILLLPISIMYHIIGLTPSIYWYMFTAVLFIVKAFSTETSGNILRTNWTKGKQESNYYKYVQQKNSIREESIAKKFKDSPNLDFKSYDSLWRKRK